ncbi:hypothetical protein CPB83DRAFT_275750 [Crepidotus variabilis]|uniref:Queuosine 5'-phosphate N-glycosylase/hydrolase n=1 Tax=Crepidotus variabilis TaxID=179855 RepID=A0A9P6EHN6_9AGAR|nr:hypothetical protein CPB83DRAFT_275750 [Crepidotus variabilis]
MPALPPSGQYLVNIRQSCRNLRVASGILIEPETIKRLLISPAFTTSFERVSKDHGLLLPLKFASHLEELNFISILSLLNFASGFRVPLHTQTGRGAWDSIRALCFSLFITSTTEGDLLSAKGLQTLSTAKISELMRINLHVEKPHAKIPGVVVGELGGPLFELVTMIVDVLKETGEILEKSGYSNLGAFVVEALQEGKKVQNTSDDAAVEVILERLATAFPAFRDVYEIDRQPVYCFKKALFLVHAIHVRFGSMSPLPFPVPNTENIPVFSDNVLPSLLIHLGVINLPTNSPLSRLFPSAAPQQLDSLLGPAPPQVSKIPETVPKEGSVVTIEQSYILRAAAVDACELIVETAHGLDHSLLQEEDKRGISKLSLPDLDMWLWAVAKDRPDYRALERFVDQNSIYF